MTTLIVLLHPVAVRWHMRERGEDQWEELLPLERPFYR